MQSSTTLIKSKYITSDPENKDTITLTGLSFSIPLG